MNDVPLFQLYNIYQRRHGMNEVTNNLVYVTIFGMQITFLCHFYSRQILHICSTIQKLLFMRLIDGY